MPVFFGADGAIATLDEPSRKKREVAIIERSKLSYDRLTALRLGLELRYVPLFTHGLHRQRIPTPCQAGSITYSGLPTNCAQGGRSPMILIRSACEVTPPAPSLALRVRMIKRVGYAGTTPCRVSPDCPPFEGGQKPASRRRRPKPIREPRPAPTEGCIARHCRPAGFCPPTPLPPETGGIRGGFSSEAGGKGDGEAQPRRG
jgi:hypothetical protein